eukprot:5910125-Alexandrium_andersonii.AAC.1
MKSVFRGTKSGWVDRHVRIEGPAAADLANSFADRWNSQVDRFKQLWLQATPWRNFGQRLDIQEEEEEEE